MLISSVLGEAQTTAQTAVGAGAAAAMQLAIQKALAARQKQEAAAASTTVADQILKTTLATIKANPTVNPALATGVANLDPTKAVVTATTATATTSTTSLVVLGVAVVGAVAFAVLKSRKNRGTA
jgi:hypothetical protein